MSSCIKIAWRNLWRNKRRTLITSASIFFGVLFSTAMTSMQYGSYDSMVNNIVRFYSGYIQIFSEEYHKNKTINNTFVLTDSLINLIENTKEITNYAPRLEYFALASSAELTKGTVVVGIDPERENIVTGLKKRVVEGNYLEKDDTGVLIGIDLANYLKITIGDTLVLYGQGYHGVMAAGLFPVRGFLQFALPEMNQQFVYLELQACQSFFSAENSLTSLVMMVHDHYDLPKAMKVLKPKIRPPLMIQSWAEMQPELVQMIEADKASGVLTKALLYLIISFGIFGTILMMISERMRELGVMVSIGLQRTKLAAILFFETVFIGLIGAAAGIVISIPLVAYFVYNPVKLTGNAANTMIDMGIEPYMYFSNSFFVFYNQALTVFVITLIISLYPIYKALTLQVNKALKA